MDPSPPPGKVPGTPRGVLARPGRSPALFFFLLLGSLALIYEHPAILGNTCALAVPACFLLSLREGCRFVYHLLCCAPSDGGYSLVRASGWFAAMLPATFGAILGLHLGQCKLERACAPVMQALEEHRTRTGRYPKHLGELVPDIIVELPEGFFDRSQVGSPFGITYDGADSTRGTGYSLCGWLSQGMYRCTYRSTTRTWEIWD